MPELSVDSLVSACFEDGHGSPVGCGPLRLLPKAAIKSARDLLDANRTSDGLVYVLHAFNVYRATVCRNMFAPHVLVDDAYEWPEPFAFPWSAVDQVVVYGEHVNGPVPDRRSGVRVGTRTADKIVSRDIAVDSAGIITGEVIQEHRALPSRDDAGAWFNYRFPDDGSRVLFVFAHDWQLNSLARYANPVHGALLALQHPRADADGIRLYFSRILSTLEQPQFLD